MSCCVLGRTLCVTITVSLFLCLNFSQRFWSCMLELKPSVWSCLHGVFSPVGPAGETRCWNFSTSATSTWNLQIPLKPWPQKTLQTTLQKHDCRYPVKSDCLTASSLTSNWANDRSSTPVGCFFFLLTLFLIKILLLLHRFLIYNLHACGTFDLSFLVWMNLKVVMMLFERWKHFSAAVLNPTTSHTAIRLPTLQVFSLLSTPWHSMCLREDQSIAIFTLSMLF